MDQVRPSAFVLVMSHVFDVALAGSGTTFQNDLDDVQHSRSCEMSLAQSKD